jgi:hypothetical protein
MAPDLVHDLIAWQRWDFVSGVERARDALGADPLAVYSLGLYLRLARGEGAFGGSHRRSGASASTAAD